MPECKCICYCEHTLAEHAELALGGDCKEDCYCAAFERYQEEDAPACSHHQLGCVRHLDGYCFCGDIDASGQVLLCKECFSA